MSATVGVCTVAAIAIGLVVANKWFHERKKRRTKEENAERARLWAEIDKKRIERATWWREETLRRLNQCEDRAKVTAMEQQRLEQAGDVVDALANMIIPSAPPMKRGVRDPYSGGLSSHAILGGSDVSAPIPSTYEMMQRANLEAAAIMGLFGGVSSSGSSASTPASDDSPSRSYGSDSSSSTSYTGSGGSFDGGGSSGDYSSSSSSDSSTSSSGD